MSDSASSDMSGSGRGPGAASETAFETWYTATQSTPPERARLTFDIDTDVCVIGGGLAGLTTARELARRGWSVVVLEAKKTLGEGASGRNDGFVLPGFSADPAAIVQRVGRVHAKELWDLSERGLAYVREAIRADEIADAELGTGWLHVSQISESADDEAGGAALHSLALLSEFGAHVERWPAARVHGRLRSERYFHAVHHPRALHIHPLNYINGLAKAAVAAGARIFVDTPALSIDPAGIRKRVETASGRVRAAHIVLAANVGLGRLSPTLAATLFPFTSHVAATAPIGPELAQAIDYPGAVSDTNGANFHYRVVGGDRLMWGGGGAVWPAGRRTMAARLARGIADTYPQLPPVKIEYLWSGTMGATLHRMPQIGEVTPGLWLASGFGGHGLNTTAMAGELIAAAIAERDDRWRLFLPYELVWAGGFGGKALAQSVFMWRQRREAFAANLARRRHTRQNAARLAARKADAAARLVLGSSEGRPADDKPVLTPPVAE